MSYPSIDALQKKLAEEIFGDRKDIKKASGRALGTLLELISYYLLQEWELTNNVIIELKIPEFGNDDITHNVEFAMHPIKSVEEPEIEYGESTTSSGFRKQNPEFKNKFDNYDLKYKSLLSKDLVQRNNCVLGEKDSGKLMLNFFKEKSYLVELSQMPFAMVECKRVGVEEGNKKGPTTIEKAKQGAYVAKSVSALQKVRSRKGELLGFYETNEGEISFLNFKEELDRLVYEATPEEMKGFVLTIGIVSNHGNWYSEEKLNKELLVLKDSYDWLLFFKDESMVEFVQDTIIDPKEAEYEAIKKAFEDSYNKDIKGNKLTKVNLYRDAHLALTNYFAKNITHIEENWFNVITPSASKTIDLKNILTHLKKKMNK